jgi:hypothetical protein
MVIVVLADVEPLVVQVMEGALTVTLEHVTPLNSTSAGLEVVILLKENVDADGEAIFTPLPGNVTTIVPPEGIDVAVLNEIVCTAVMFVTRTSVCEIALLERPEVK